MTALTYNDAQLDGLARAVYYDTAKAALVVFNPSGSSDPELIHAYAHALDAASCGFDTASDDDDEDLPPGMKQSSPYNDDLLNEISRQIYVQALDKVRDYVTGKQAMNVDKMQAYAHLADAAASAFQEDEDAD